MLTLLQEQFLLAQSWAIRLILNKSWIAIKDIGANICNWYQNIPSISRRIDPWYHESYQDPRCLSLALIVPGHSGGCAMQQKGLWASLPDSFLTHSGWGTAVARGGVSSAKRQQWTSYWLMQILAALPTSRMRAVFVQPWTARADMHFPTWSEGAIWFLFALRTYLRMPLLTSCHSQRTCGLKEDLTSDGHWSGHSSLALAFTQGTPLHA